MIAQNLQDQYSEISMQLLGHEPEQSQSISEELLQSYAQCVRRLYALLKENNLRGHQVCHMYETLAIQLFTPSKVNKCLGKTYYYCLFLI